MDVPADAPVDEPAEHVRHDAFTAFLRAHHHVTAGLASALRSQHDLSYGGFEILCRLLDQEPQPARTLAGRLVSLSPTRASRVIQELASGGLLTRRAHRGDGRVSLIALTPEGRRRARQALGTFEATLSEGFLAPLDPGDLAALARIGDKLEDRHGPAHSTDGPPRPQSR